MNINKSDQPIKRIFLHIFMGFLALLAIVPIYVMLINAVRSTEQINSGLTIIFERNSFASIINDNLATIRAKDHERGLVRLENFNQPSVSYIYENDEKRILYFPEGVEIELELDEFYEDDIEDTQQSYTFSRNTTSPRIIIYHEVTNEIIAIYYLDPGLFVDVVEDGDAVRPGSVLFRRFLAIADVTGTVRYVDLVEPQKRSDGTNFEGIYKIETDKNGKTVKYINEYLAVMNDSDRSINNRVHNPKLNIVDDNGNLLRSINLTSGLFLNVEEGERVKPGTVLFDRIKRPPNIIYNWKALVSRGFRMFRGFFNSATIAILSTLLVVYFSALTAYGLHVYRFKGRLAMWALILVIMMLPGSLTFIGFYQLMASWRLTDSYIPLILPGIAAAGAVLFIRQYMMSVLNMELVDAARIDGAGEFHTFNRIIIPLIVPALAAQSIFAFVGSWNNFLAPTVLLSTQDKFTLPLFVALLRGDIYRTETGAIYLGIAISLVPIIIFYCFMARYIISGLTMGSVKE